MTEKAFLAAALGAIVVGLAAAHESPEHTLEALDRRLSIDGSEVVLLVRRADELRSLGRLDEAAAAYRRALDLAPEATLAAVGLSRTLLDLGDYAAATASARKAARCLTDPSAAAALQVVVARAAEACGDDQAALAAWERALESPDLEVDWLLAHAECAGRVSGSGAQRRALEAAVKRNPSVVLRRELLSSQIACGDVESAMQEIEAGLQRSRWKSGWLLLRARAYTTLGDKRNAERDLRDALTEINQRLASHPGNPALQRQLTEVNAVDLQSLAAEGSSGPH